MVSLYRYLIACVKEAPNMHDRETLHQKSGKADFELIYDLDDPREYFNVLGLVSGGYGYGGGEQKLRG